VGHRRIGIDDFAGKDWFTAQNKMNQLQRCNKLARQITCTRAFFVALLPVDTV
jgi:hypothetical protein